VCQWWCLSEFSNHLPRNSIKSSTLSLQIAWCKVATAVATLQQSGACWGWPTAIQMRVKTGPGWLQEESGALNWASWEVTRELIQESKFNLTDCGPSPLCTWVTLQRTDLKPATQKTLAHLVHVQIRWPQCHSIRLAPT